MFKKILLYIVAVAALCYLVFSLFFITKSDEEMVCKGVKATVAKRDIKALSDEEVMNIVKRNNMDPTGKPMKDIDCSKIEDFFGGMSIVEECQSYKSHKGIVGIVVHCKEPIMQVFDKNGKEFYIDHKGDIIENIHNAMYLPVASGNISRDMAGKELLTIAKFMQDNRFWNEQTEQVYFDEKGEVILVPRIGNHIIELGKPDKLEAKLEKLKTFYEKGLGTVGWNKYNKINIEIDKQVICTKRK